MRIFIAAQDPWVTDVITAQIKKSVLLRGKKIKEYNEKLVKKKDVVLVVFNKRKVRYEDIHNSKGQIIAVSLPNYRTTIGMVEGIAKMLQAKIDGKVFLYRTTDDYVLTLYNAQFNTYSNGTLRVSNYSCKTFDREACPIGLEHMTCEFGKRTMIPINGRGNFDDPRWIFVGEAPGRKGCGTFGLPFYNEKSGNYFNTALFSLGISPIECYVTNTIRCCPENNDLKDYKKLSSRMELECVQRLKTELSRLLEGGGQLVGIGKIAQSTLSKLGFKRFKKMYHPSYFLRQGLSVDEYTKHMKAQLK